MEKLSFRKIVLLLSLISQSFSVCHMSSTPPCLFFLIGGYSGEVTLASLLHQQERYELHKLGAYPTGGSPSFLALHPSLQVVYAANETDAGSVQAFALALEGYDGSHQADAIAIRSLGEPVSTEGSGPAAIAVDPTGRWLLFANYGSGSYGVIGIDESSGMLQGPKPVSLIQLPSPTAPNGSRPQSSPHPHQMLMHGGERWVFVCDLGSDVIHVNQLYYPTGALLPHGSATLVEGSGPRHMVFSSDGRFSYVINELRNTVAQFSYDPAAGALSFLKEWSTLNGTATPDAAAAELALSPDGKFLYASNRGSEEDTMAVFEVNPGSGELEVVGMDPVGGSGPRHFALTPTGHILVALQKSNKVTLLHRNEITGRLSIVSSIDSVTSPSYIQLLKA